MAEANLSKFLFTNTLYNPIHVLPVVPLYVVHVHVYTLVYKIHTNIHVQTLAYIYHVDMKISSKLSANIPSCSTICINLK